jgi:hypothetical protein
MSPRSISDPDELDPGQQIRESVTSRLGRSSARAGRPTVVTERRPDPDQAHGAQRDSASQSRGSDRIGRLAQPSGHSQRVLRVDVARGRRVTDSEPTRGADIGVIRRRSDDERMRRAGVGTDQLRSHD